MKSLLDLGYELVKNDADIGYLTFKKLVLSEDDYEIEKEIVISTRDHTFKIFAWDPVWKEVYDEETWFTEEEAIACLEILKQD